MSKNPKKHAARKPKKAVTKQKPSRSAAILATTDEMPLDEGRSLTRAAFCELEDISLSTYYKLKRKGHGPFELHFPGMTAVRITPQSRREWHVRCAEWAASKAAKIQAARRTETARHAGELAAASPLHASKRSKVEA